jgi:hypothetical protein
MQEGLERVRGLSPATKMILGAGVIGVVAFGGWHLLREETPASNHSPSVHVSDAPVKAEVSPPRAAQKSYAAGKSEESHGQYREAAQAYAKAAHKGDKRGLKKLVAMTHARSCEARSEAADALGTLHSKKAIAALKKLARKNYKDESRGLFSSCSSKSAAQKALQKQGHG